MFKLIIVFAPLAVWKMACISPPCGICDSKQRCVPSTAWCFECNAGLCGECKELHILNKASKSHGIIPVNEFQKLPVSVLQNAESCKSHGDRYQAFCGKHECSCCSKCLIEDHKNCKDFTDIKDVVCKIKSSNTMLEIENSMREVTADLQRIQKNRAGNLSSLKLQRQTIKKEIQKARHTVHNHFDRLEGTLLKELHIIENNERKKISKIVASVERKQKEIDELQKNLSKLKQHESDLQTYLFSKQIEHALMESEILIQSIQNNDELSDVIISFQTNDMMKCLENISKFWQIVVQTSQSDIALVRQNNKKTQAKVDIVTEGYPGHHYETIKTEEDSCFIVTVKPANDALKFGLNGQYRLCITTRGFILEDTQKKTPKCCWSFSIVRKFGKKGIEKEFEISVGRRNLLGEGTVVLLCSSNDEPYQISRIAEIIIEGMKSKIKH